MTNPRIPPGRFSRSPVYRGMRCTWQCMTRWSAAAPVLITILYPAGANCVSRSALPEKSSSGSAACSSGVVSKIPVQWRNGITSRCPRVAGNASHRAYHNRFCRTLSSSLGEQKGQGRSLIASLFVTASGLTGQGTPAGAQRRSPAGGRHRQGQLLRIAMCSDRRGAQRATVL